MLTTSKEMLLEASKNGYAVPAINTQVAIMTLSGQFVKRLRI